MDSDDEDLLAELLDEEAQADIDDEEHLLVLACLAGLLDKAKPRRGGSKPGRRKSKPRRVGHMVLPLTLRMTICACPSLAPLKA